MKPSFSFLLIPVLCTALAGCGAARNTVPETTAATEPAVMMTTAPTTAATEPEPTLSPEEELLSSMTLRQKVGQLFIVRPDALDLSLSQAAIDDPQAPGATELTETMRQTLQNYPVGGFIHFQKNIVSPEQITAFNQALRESMSIAPFLSVDEEGGPVARIGGSPSFPVERFQNAASVGAQGLEAAQAMGSTIGSYLAQYGFNMDFAPVADVNTNPMNPVIGSRAFSSDPVEAATCARAAADGLRMNGIVPVFKHFPGHGDTAEDSHDEIAVSRKTPEQLIECEWIPFRQADDRECVMVGHIAVPELTGDMTPASMSGILVSGCLRDELGFQGLVVTDSLSMGAVTRSFSSGEAAFRAFNAGCDLLLMPASLTDAFDTMVSAVEEGVLSEEALDQSVLRILRAKLDYHIL